ncbi:MAG TPA: VOC family protein, partial [Pseudolysinimonas sp.]|nr:VOC family protein [Pseudolysinimonas sp.]
MQKLIRAGLVLGLVAAALPALAETPSGSLAALSTQPSMNVFRRFAVDRERMIEFYGEVLGLKQLPSLRLGGGNEMILFAIGTGQVKLQATPAASQYPNGDVKAVTGLRVLTFFYPDEASVVSRFTAKGYPAPAFVARAGGGRVAMALDPEKQWVELVVMPNAPPAAYQRLEVGITAANLEKSRAFYRSFVGLEELTPVVDPVLGTTKYPFRHGETTINVWSF